MNHTSHTSIFISTLMQINHSVQSSLDKKEKTNSQFRTKKSSGSFPSHVKRSRIEDVIDNYRVAMKGKGRMTSKDLMSSFNVARTTINEALRNILVPSGNVVRYEKISGAIHQYHYEWVGK